MTNPWTIEQLGAGRFRFTNATSGKLAMIGLSPIDDAEVAVEGCIADDPWTVPSPVDAGAAFVAVVRGAGARITATSVPSMRPVFQELEVTPPPVRAARCRRVACAVRPCPSG